MDTDFGVHFSSKYPISPNDSCHFGGSSEFNAEGPNDSKLKMAASIILHEYFLLQHGLCTKKYCLFFGDMDSNFFDNPLEKASRMNATRSVFPTILFDKKFRGNKTFHCNLEEDGNSFLYTSHYMGFGFLKRYLTDDTRIVFPLLFLIHLWDKNKDNPLFLLQLTCVSNLAGRWLLHKWSKLGVKPGKAAPPRLLDTTICEIVRRVDPDYEGPDLDYEPGITATSNYGVLESYELVGFERHARELQKYSKKNLSGQ